MDHLHLTALILAGAAAGFVNAVAGGGTIITFPMLVLVGTDSVRANATSTVALIFGIVGSIYGYRRQISAVKTWLWEFTPCSLVGGLLGGILLTLTPSRIFDHLVPGLILFATVLFMSQSWISRRMGRGTGETPSAPTWEAVLLQFFIAVYGGYFGAGIGILMLAALGFVGLKDIHQMNTVKTILGGLINIVAAAYFAWKGMVDWPKAAIIALGAAPGYYAGSAFSQSISPATVRRMISAIGLLIAAYMAWKELAPAGSP